VASGIARFDRPGDAFCVDGKEVEMETLTPNQVVAFNLSEARRLRGWTQQRAAAELEPYVGVRWSKASFSAAERSVDGIRVRKFSADHIVAFARCFEVSVEFFFEPPPPPRRVGRGVPHAR
jgi:hypothetical protein